jgi:membrane protein YdbS with pleckstrin-like domain
VDRRAIRLWSVQAALRTAGVAAGLAVLAAVVEPGRAWLSFALVGGIVGGALYVVAMPRIRYRVHRWEVTDVAVYARSGWLTHEWRVAPLSRVQTVDARRSPLEQAFGLSSVRITTASASGDVTIEGLDRHRAADLVESLTAATQATPGDAT